MTIKDLEYFAAIARTASITRAAEELFIAQPALSQCLQKLEKEVGVPLFVRRSRGVYLTPQGECFLDFAQNVLEHQESMRREMREVEEGERGSIRLGFTGSQATYVLPHVLPRFQALHPNITVTLVEASSNEIEEKLLSHQVDLGILHLPVLREGLKWFELSRDEMVVLPRRGAAEGFVYEKAGRQYLRPSFFQEEAVILTPPGQRSRMICDQIFSAMGVLPHVKQLSRSLSTLDALVQVDYASTLLPSKQVSPALRQRGWYHLEAAEGVPYAFVAATARDAALPLAVETMMEHLRSLELF